MVNLIERVSPVTIKRITQNQYHIGMEIFSVWGLQYIVQNAETQCCRQTDGNAYMYNGYFNHAEVVLRPLSI